MADNEEPQAPITLGSSPAVSPLDDLGSSGDDGTALYKGLKELNKMKSKKHKNLAFTGIILSVKKIQSQDLQLKTSRSFVDTLPVRPGGYAVYEYKVFINEINSSLPILTKAQLDEYNKLKEKYATGVNTNATGVSPDQKEYIRFKLYERIINRFLSVYHIPSSGNETLGGPYMTCKVEFPDENKMFFGKAVKINSASA
jgi:hypothetical protein